MGYFSVTIEVGSPDRRYFETVEVLANTGATYTMLPSPILDKLGIEPLDARTCQVPGAKQVICKIGEAPLRIGDRVFTSPVVFSDESHHPVLGTVTLNAFGLGIEGNQLVPVEGFLVGIRKVNE